MSQLDASSMKKIMEAWKSKSLNSKTTQKYGIPLEGPKIQTIDRDINKVKQKKDLPKTSQPVPGQNQLLPEPKFIKINEQVFCCYLKTCLKIFKLINNKQKQKMKKHKQNLQQKTFQSFNVFFNQNIKFIVSNHSEYIYIALQNQLHILNLEKINKQEIKDQTKNCNQLIESQIIQKKNIPRIKGISFIRQLRDKIEIQFLVVITNDRILKYKLTGTRQETERPVQQIKIVLKNKKDELIYNQLSCISILCENQLNLYFFATQKGQQTEINQKSQGIKSKCQYLYLVQFNLDIKGGQTMTPSLEKIDHVFQIGIFSKSKIFQVGMNNFKVFLISLFEEIIVVKKHFQKYVVWDNISLAPTKSIQKKGQLVLADKIVMVYTQAGQIYAHNIYFCTKDYKLKYPRIDNFKGRANQDQNLYDAIVLEYLPGSFMKVLFYFKQTEVFTPSHQFRSANLQKNYQQKKQLNISILCIKQNQPVDKLRQLYKLKKTPQQIAQFVQRFKIRELERSKCEWQVSDKTQKDIENLLLQIKDNQYIQNQLTSILKSNPHDLKFLNVIQKKQTERYKKMLATKLFKCDQNFSREELNHLKSQTGSLFTREEIQEIKKIIQWVMESIMFEKKLLYSRSFLEFMEYDFIDIGKLKAASLKQQIKLLSCKGYIERLKFFLNNFKYMVLANFEDIFNFLIDGKKAQQVKQFFLKSFPFIIPNYNQTSYVYMQKKARQRKQTFSLKNNQIDLYKFPQQGKQQRCVLWQNKFNDKNQMQKFETIQSFKNIIQKQLVNLDDSLKSKTNKKSQWKEGLKYQQAKSQFEQIFKKFITQSWFQNNKSKLHSIICIDVQTLQNQFNYFVRIGVFHLLIKFFYKNIREKIYTHQQVQDILQSFKNPNKSGKQKPYITPLIPESFQHNILARKQVYNLVNLLIPKCQLEDFLIFQQTDYFDILFIHCRKMLLNEIKNCYDEHEKHKMPGFFKQKFQIYLNSDKINLHQIIQFLQCFQGNKFVDIRLDIFTCIKNLLKVSDKKQTSFFVDKLMELQILKTQGNSHSGIDSLIDEAKIAFGYYFHNFFSVFDIQQTYKQLIHQTTVSSYEDCHIIKTMVEKYCEYEDQLRKQRQNQQNRSQQQIQKYQLSASVKKYKQIDQIIFQPCFGLQKIQFSIKQQPIQFFGILLYLIDTLRFEIQPQIVFDKFIELQLKHGCFQNIVTFIVQFKNLMGSQQFDQQMNQQDFNEYKSRNYILLEMFYHQSNFTIQDRLANNIITWIKKLYKCQYESIPKSLTITYISKKYNQTGIFKNIQSAYHDIITQLNLSNIQLIRQKSFLSLLTKLQQIQPHLVHYVLQRRFQNFDDNYLQENSSLLNQVSGFIFMIRLLHQIPKSKFDQINKGKINQQIYLMLLIYQHFIAASKYNDHQNKQNNMQLSNFFIQLAMRLIKDKQFIYCEQVLITQCNFQDIFYQFLTGILKQSKKKPSVQQFTKFIKKFIGCSSVPNMRQQFSSFLLQNQINKIVTQENQLAVEQKKQFIKPRDRRNSMYLAPGGNRESAIYNGFNNFIVQEKDVNWGQRYTVIIFQCLLQSHRVDQAYYFLVRNSMLNIVKATQIGYNNVGTQGQALISIYLKCLRQYLCSQFFPTFDFYRNKLRMLQNNLERKDIIKDINIAISRLKQTISQKKLSLQALRSGQRMIVDFIQKKLGPQIKIDDDKQNTQQGKKKSQGQQQTQTSDALKNDLIKLQQYHKQLQTLYQKYMKSQNLDPIIKLNEQDIIKGNAKLQYMNTQITPYQQQQHINRNRIPASPRFETSQNINNKFENGFTANQLSKRNIVDSQKQIQSQRRKIKQNPYTLQFQKQVNNQIKQSKSLLQKYEKSQNLIPKQNIRNTKNTNKAYQQLKQREKAEIDSVKDSYKSHAAQRVNQIIQQMKLRRSKIYQKSDGKSKFSKVSIQQSQQMRSRKNSFEIPNNFIPIKNHNQQLITPPNIKPNLKRQQSGQQSNVSNQLGISRKYQVKIRGVDGQSKNIYMPVTMNNKEEKQSGSRVSLHSKNSNNVIDTNNSPNMNLNINSNVNPNTNPNSNISNLSNRNIKSQIRSDLSSAINLNIGLRNPNQHLTKSHIKITLQEILKLFAQRQPQCVKYVQKLQIVKNSHQIGLQITKNIYSTINNFDVFVRYIGFLLQNYPKYNQIIQQKAYKIASQSMGIQCKINLKQLFPIQIFTTVCNVSLKQYYKTAYQILRPNLLKILSKPETSIHGMAVLFRYGFGSQNIYYYRIYQDYIKVLLKQYNESNSNSMDDKKLLSLAEKLRSYYQNINPQNRQIRFEQLIRQVNNQQKRKILVKYMNKVLERRSQMLTGEKQTDLKNILEKLR